MNADDDEKEKERNVLIYDTVSKSVKLLQDFTTYDIKYLKYMMALLNNQTISVEPETNWDIKIDETVSAINTLLEPLTDRQRIYALGLLNSTMGHFFEKLGMQEEMQGLVCCMVKSILRDMAGMVDEKEKESHD